MNSSNHKSLRNLQTTINEELLMNTKLLVFDFFLAGNQLLLICWMQILIGFLNGLFLSSILCCHHHEDSILSL